MTCRWQPGWLHCNTGLLAGGCQVLSQQLSSSPPLTSAPLHSCRHLSAIQTVTGTAIALTRVLCAGSTRPHLQRLAAAGGLPGFLLTVRCTWWMCLLAWAR